MPSTEHIESTLDSTTSTQEGGTLPRISRLAHPIQNLARILAPEEFYIVPVVSDRNTQGVERIRPIGIGESVAYLLRTRKLPRDPKLAFVVSGGAVKGYISVGILKRLDELGIPIGEYWVTSVGSLLLVKEITGSYETFEKFALKTSELLPERVSPLSKLERVLWGSGKEFVHSVGLMLNMVKSRRHKLPDGTYIKINEGLVRTEDFESEAQKYCGNAVIGDFPHFHIRAIQYSSNGEESRLVDFAKDFPEMPAHLAMRAGISIPKLFSITVYEGKLFGDAGLILNFPLEARLLSPDVTTVMALDLHYNAKHTHQHNYGGFRGIFNIDDELWYIRDKRQTELLVREATEMNLLELQRRGDVKNNKYLICTPEINGIPPNTLRLEEHERRMRIQEGYDYANSYIVPKLRRVA